MTDFAKNNSFTVVHQDLKMIRDIRFLTKNTFVVRMDRNDLDFRAGQHISVGPRYSNQLREYSIYSGEKEDYIEILVREIIEGNISLKLKNFQPGEFAQLKNPRGRLIMSKEDIHQRKHVFIASGTGIAPFHSYVRSYPGLDYQILHGVRFSNEAYDKEDYHPGRYFLCTSKDESGDYSGRVTDFLDSKDLDPENIYHIVGNSQMVMEVRDILQNKGVPEQNQRTEVYF